MQINIKLKFDKTNKSSIWQPQTKPFFLQKKDERYKQATSGKKELQSFRQNREHLTLYEKEPIYTHRQRSKDMLHRTHKKQSTSKKTSAFKPPKNPSLLGSERKSSQVKKNASDKIKKVKKRISIVNSSHNYDEDLLRNSLPGMSGKKVLHKLASVLSEAQKVQLINEKAVYYVGVGSGAGEDDLEGTYLWRKHEQIGYRYELLERLGSGAFGEVVQAYDHKLKEIVAVKIIKSKTEHMQLALNEINILMRIKERDIENKRHVLRIKDFIVFRKHICIITQLLSLSLYELIECNNFGSLDLKTIRIFAIQLLTSLAFLKDLNIIHSDLKPENVLIRNKAQIAIKLIDFGTSMFLHEATFLYIQSRFYRAPEIILGGKYDFAIDMWSFGCLMAELYLGYPLFAGDNEQEQLSLIMRCVGTPSKQYLQNCKNANKYFAKDGSPKIIKGKDAKAIIPSTKTLPTIIQDQQFCSFMQRILTLDPEERLSCAEALIDPWIVASFPEDIKKEHINEITLKIRKEAHEKNDKKKNPERQGSSFKQHKKRNSDFSMTKGHKRRVSEGFF